MSVLTISKKTRRAVNKKFGHLMPSWMRRHHVRETSLSIREKDRRRAQDKRARASRKRNRRKK